MAQAPPQNAPPLSTFLSHHSVSSAKDQTVSAFARWDFPMLKTNATMVRHICFCIDTSGSMFGDIDTVKRVLTIMLDILEENTEIRLFSFSNEISQLGKTCFLTHNNREVMKGCLNQMFCDGLTNTEMAIQTMVEETNKSFLATQTTTPPEDLKNHQWEVYVFTDGLPNVGASTQEDLVESCTQLTAIPQVFGITFFGFSTNVDMKMLESLAGVWNGSFEYIETRESIPTIVGKHVGGSKFVSVRNFNWAFEGDAGDETKETKEQWTVKFGLSHVPLVTQGQSLDLWAIRDHCPPTDVVLKWSGEFFETGEWVEKRGSRSMPLKAVDTLGDDEGKNAVPSVFTNTRIRGLVDEKIRTIHSWIQRGDFTKAKETMNIIKDLISQFQEDEVNKKRLLAITQDLEKIIENRDYERGGNMITSMSRDLSTPIPCTRSQRNASLMFEEASRDNGSENQSENRRRRMRAPGAPHRRARRHRLRRCDVMSAIDFVALTGHIPSPQSSCPPFIPMNTEQDDTKKSRKRKRL